MTEIYLHIVARMADYRRAAETEHELASDNSRLKIVYDQSVVFRDAAAAHGLTA